MNYEIDILTEKEESEKRQQDFKDKTENFIKNLEVDETLGQLLVAEGFSFIKEISDAKIDEISKIEGLDNSTAEEEKRKKKEEQRRKKKKE